MIRWKIIKTRKKTNNLNKYKLISKKKLLKKTWWNYL